MPKEQALTVKPARASGKLRKLERVV